jgi:hypothetical protein
LEIKSIDGAEAMQAGFHAAPEVVALSDHPTRDARSLVRNLSGWLIIWLTRWRIARSECVSPDLATKSLTI